MHKEVCPAQISTAAQLSTGMQGFGGRGTLPMAGHSQGPAQHCDTASASKGTAAFPPAGHTLTMATPAPAAWH